MDNNRFGQQLIKSITASSFQKYTGFSIAVGLCRKQNAFKFDLGRKTMKQSDRVRGAQKLQFGALILLCLIGGFGCGGGGSSTPSVDLLTPPQTNVSGGLDIESQDVSVIQQKSVRPRKGVCWNGRSELREVNRQRLRNSANKSYWDFFRVSEAASICASMSFISFAIR